MGGAGITRQIYRDGNKVLIDQSLPPSHAGSKGSHVRMVYDLQAHTIYSWDLINPNAPCSPGRFDGDGNWQDPFTFAGSMNAEIAKGSPKHLGTEAINGVTAEVLEAAGPDSRAKIWIEQTYGLVIRLQVGMGSGPYETKYEVKNRELFPAGGLGFRFACGVRPGAGSAFDGVDAYRGGYRRVRRGLRERH